MSTEILVGLIGVGGVLAGVFAERWFQRRGKIRCTFGELFVQAYNNSATIHKGSLPVDIRAVEGLAYEVSASYEINVKLFNEKDSRTGLRDVALQFVSTDGFVILEDTSQVSEFPDKRILPTKINASQIRYLDPVAPKSTEVINFPSREWVNLTISGVISGEAAQKLANCDQARLKGYSIWEDIHPGHPWSGPRVYGTANVCCSGTAANPLGRRARISHSAPTMNSQKRFSRRFHSSTGKNWL